MAHPRLGSCVKNEKGNSGRWRTERGKKGRRVVGPFTMLHARIKQRVNGHRTDQRTTNEKRGRAAPSHYIRQRQVHVRPYGETVRRQPVGWSSRR